MGKSLTSKAYTQAVILLPIYGLDVAAEVAIMEHRLDEYQAEDLIKRLKRFHG